MRKDISNKKEKHSSGRVMDFIAKIVCIIVAFFIWFYAMSTDVVTLERSFTVPIVFENEDVLLENTGWSVLSGKGNNIEVTLKGKRNIINKINESDIRATVDVADVSKAGNQELSIKVSAPTECEVVNTSVTSITPYIDKRVSMSVPVTVTLIEQSTSINQELETSLTIDTVEITGPEAELLKVGSALAELSPGHVTSSLKMTAPLKLLDKSGRPFKSDYVSLTTKTVNVNVKLIATKEVILEVGSKYGYYNDTNVDITLSPEVITVRGEPSLLEETFKDGKYVVAVLDEKKYEADSKLEVAISLAEGITLTSMESVVKIDIKHINTDVKKLKVNNIQLKNSGGLNCETLDDGIIITLRGPRDLIAAIGEDDITLTADMKNYSSTGVIVDIPVSVGLPAEYAGLIYELGSPSVRVSIK